MTDMTAAEARAAVDAVRAGYDDLTARITELWQRRAWIALGHESFEALCDAELPNRQLLRLERQAAVGEMRSAGMSTRAIAAATGASHQTVMRDAGGPSGPPGPITGLDGKTYTPPSPSPPTEPAELLDLRSGLVRIIGLLNIVAGCVEDLGADAVSSDNQAVEHMLTISHLTASIFGPFVSADAVDQAAARWATT